MTTNCPLQALFTAQDISNSTVVADVYSNGCNGVDVKNFELLHQKLSTSGYFTCSEWQQEVSYTAKAHCSDEDQSKVSLRYNGSDPMDVSCTRSKVLHALHFKTNDETYSTHVYRKMISEVQPPSSNERYSKVCIRMQRTLVRRSSSVKDLDWKYVFAVEWSARSVREAYAATPLHKLSLEVDTRPLHPDLKDDLKNLQSGVPNYKSIKDAADSLNMYLASTLFLKLQELVCAALLPSQPRTFTKIIYKNDDLHHEGEDQEQMLMPEDDDQGDDDQGEAMFADDDDDGQHNGDYE